MESKTRNGLVVIGRDARLLMTDKRWETIVDGTSGTTALQTEKGFVWLEWVGQPSPFDDRTVQHLIARKRIPPDLLDMLRAIARNRIVRIDNISDRIVTTGNGPGDIAGLSQEWHFGPKANRAPGMPGAYIQRVPNRDADKIMSSIIQNEFRVIGLLVEKPDAVLVATERVKQKYATAEMTLGPEQRFRTGNALHRAMGRLPRGETS